MPEPTPTAAYVPAPLPADTPSAGPAPPAPPPPGPPRVPGYDVLGEVGRGGMGVVYRARHLALGRDVALKMVLAGDYATPEQVVRFLLEAEAAARVQHPHVVQVFEVGRYEGRPYVAFEYVAGGTLAERLAGTPLPPRAAAELVATLADAVAAAHAAGVIHRDLKPANVLLDGAGRPKVADFGLAKRLGGGAAGLTGTGAILGTPSYMAPEQARGQKDVGTAADVWALGAILYECLTGRPPFRGADVPATLRLVCEAEPAAPRSLAPGVPRDLAVVAVTCLAKEPARRYATAAALADDLRRFVEGRAVAARPVGGAERAWRWCRRNPAVAGLAAAVALLLAGGAVGAAALAAWALGERDTAVAAAAAERQAKDAERAAKDAERRAKEDEAAGRRQAEAVADLLESAFKGLNPRAAEKGGPDLNDQLVGRLTEVVGKIDREAGGDPLTAARLRNALGLAFLGLGEAVRAEPLFERAARDCTARLGPDHPLTLTSRSNLATAYNTLGRSADAARLHEETLRLRAAKLGPDHPETLTSRSNLAVAYLALGRAADAARLHEETLRLHVAKLGPDHPLTLASRSNLATAYNTLGRSADAARLHEETLRLHVAKLGPDHPLTLTSRSGLAAAYAALGRPADAARLDEETLRLSTARLGPDHPDTLTSRNNLAAAYAALGRSAEAARLHEETLRLSTAKLGPDHPATLNSRSNLAVVYLALGRAADAEPLLRNCLAARAKAQPDAWTTANTRARLGGSLLGQKKYIEAEPLLRAGYDGLKARAAALPPPPRVRLLEAGGRLAAVYDATGRPGAAAVLRVEVLALADWLAATTTDARDLAGAARAYAEAAVATRRSSFAAHAVALLRAAAGRGLGSGWLASADFAPLHGRADWHDLLWDNAEGR